MRYLRLVGWAKLFDRVAKDDIAFSLLDILDFTWMSFDLPSWSAQMVLLF
jgi:hypothetical protein